MQSLTAPYSTARSTLRLSRHYWDLNAPVLASKHGCTVYTYDQRFHGESDKPSWVRAVPCRAVPCCAVKFRHAGAVLS